MGKFIFIPNAGVGVDPVLYLTLNGNSNDSSGNGLNGSDTNITYTSDYAEWTTTGSIIVVTDNDLLSFGNGSADSAFSISFMMYKDVTANKILVFKNTGTTNREYRVFITSGTLQFTLYDESAAATIQVNSNNVISNTTWYSVICTYDGSGTTSGLKIYVNNVDQTSTPSSTGTYVAMENGTGAFNIGKFDTVTTFTFDGRMKRLRVWDVALDTTQRTAVYNQDIA